MAARSILTAAEMRAAEAVLIAKGSSVQALMERAGQAAAEAIRRYAGPIPALVLCGPGNNGGDGYVIGRALREQGAEIRIATLGEAGSEAASAAARVWGGPESALSEAEPAPLLIDALFGTGLTRGLDAQAVEALMRLARTARIRVAVDLPSGVATDDGALLSAVPDFDLTVALGALKPAHLLQPASAHMGRLVVADIGIEAASRLHEIARPRLHAPGAADHKYSRGYVAVLGGEMPGAAALTAAAALRGGAGYVRLSASAFVPGLPHAIVQHKREGWDDPRVSVVALGPGLGRGAEAEQLLEEALAFDRPLVVDADALTLLGKRGVEQLHDLAHVPILTPHAGEFARLFPAGFDGSKVDQARKAASLAGAVIVYKGADTVIAAPDGRAAIAPLASAWLASAGTGDVLAGIVAAMRARASDPFEAACAAVWLHGRAAAMAGPALIADDLIDRLPAAIAECL